MAMVTLNTASETNIPKIMPYKTSSNLRDPSFATYLSSAEETFILQLAESNRSPKPHISTANQHLYLVSKKVEDNEIDVFNAAKYFNEEVGDESTPRIAKNSPPIPSPKKDTPVEMYPVKLQTRSATPSIRSESSLNSRSALLHNIPRNHQLQKRNKANRKSFLAALGCHCSCGDKNSVDIDEHIGRNSSKTSGSTQLDHGKGRKSMQDGDSRNEPHGSPWMREDLHCRKMNDLVIGLSPEDNVQFPASNPKIGNAVLEMQKPDLVVLEDDTRRKSLEVFGSPIRRKGKKSISVDRNLNVLSWDAIVPKVEEIEVSAKSGRGYNDTDSDASSDLFEIESFSTNPSQYLVRQASDGMASSITQATCYAPSEASIEWSVITASAADFSAVSDTEDLRSTISRTEALDMALNGKKTSGKEMTRRRPSILSGCNSHKAVNVAGDVHRTNEKALSGRHQRSEFLPMTRFHVESELSSFDKRNGHFGYDSGLLTCSQQGWVMHKH